MLSGARSTSLSDGVLILAMYYPLSGSILLDARAARVTIANHNPTALAKVHSGRHPSICSVEPDRACDALQFYHIGST